MDPKEGWSGLRYLSLAFSFGVTLVLFIFLGFWGGQWLDQRLGTEPFFLVLGILLGVGLAFRNLLDELGVFRKADQKKEEGTGKEPREGRKLKKKRD